MFLNKILDVLVCGGGAAGLAAGCKAASQGAQTLILERNREPGKKILITGKGRCNVTNACDGTDGLIANVPRNGKFLYSAFSEFTNADTMRFFEDMGVKLVTERGNRVFPVSYKASDIRDALVRACRQQNAGFELGRAKSLICENGRCCGVITYDGRKIFAKTVIICTGGLSYPKTGSTGDGYAMARAAGHTVTDLSGSLVPLTSDDPCCLEMQGLSLRNTGISICDKTSSKELYSDFGEMLFTHFGVSGPMILSASAVIPDPAERPMMLYIDLKPALTAEKLDERILRDFSSELNSDFGNSLGALLPRKMIPVIIKKSGIPKSQKVNSITKQQRTALVGLIKHFGIELSGRRPVSEAVITRGGVSVKEIDPRSMRSKKLPGLYFAGEIIDTDAYTGGFNLQIAFSTGVCAGKSAATEAKLL